MSALVRSLLSAGIGALVYGGWAFYVNMGDGFNMGLTTAIVQGTFSFVLTLTLTLLIEFLLRVFGAGKAATAGTIVAASSFMFCAAYSAQWLAGSPHILMTILPGWLIGSIYAATYAITSRRSTPAI